MDDRTLSKRVSPSTERGYDWHDDNEALLSFSHDGRTHLKENYWSLADAFQGVQILGGTGSGKSSGSGQALARAFLKANLGGLVLTAKTDEVLSWKRFAKAADREADLLIVDESAPIGSISSNTN